MAFHPYPQVIRAVFNPHRFGPPLGVTRASPCSWVDRPGFGSTPTNSINNALGAGLAFAAAPLSNSLASLVSSNSPDHNAKGTRSDHTPGRTPGVILPPLVGVRFQGLFHSPRRGAFHLSLTVLVRYRSHGSLQPWRVVPPASRPAPRTGRYSGTPLARVHGLPLPGCHRLWRPVPGDFAFASPEPSVAPTTPPPQGGRFRPRTVSLAATRVISRSFDLLISPPPGTEMFQFPGFALSQKTVPGA